MTLAMYRPGVDNFESRSNSSHRVTFVRFCFQILVCIMANSFIYFADLINPQLAQ